MKIAIVGPSPVPFTIGGVENLLWGLCDTINQKTPHQAEIIKLPSKELDFWSLIENYYAFYNLDLNHFDMVITTKYPSWMVRHRNSRCYMIHTLRGLYDTYHFMNMPTNVDSHNSRVNNIIRYMDENPCPNTLDMFFDMLFELKNNRDNIPDDYFSFPGPLIRKIVHYMDHFGLFQCGVKKYFAISDTVKKRKDYFPQDVNVEVIYPPSKLSQYSSGNYEYVFMVSRLDHPKRIDMLINAMRYVKTDIKLLIAGTGPQENELKELAKDDSRIHFLGFVNDDEVEEYYANSLVIPYFPYDEDYGLITIEAMMHKKAVITTVDAGGPTEFVINNETGFVTKFDAKDIGNKIDYLAKNISEAKRMGMNAYDKVANITWEYVINKLLKDVSLEPLKVVNKNVEHNIIKSGRRGKITVTSTFPIYPPQGGGQARIYNLYKNLAKEYDIEIISFTNADQKMFNGFIAPNMREVRIPKSSLHQNKEWKVEDKAGIPISDIAMITLSSYTPDYCNALKESIESSDWVVISHPYLYNEAKKYMEGKKFIYEAHNVESLMKENMLPNSHIKKKLVQEVFEVEMECCKRSEFIMTCSIEDQITLNKIYNISQEKMIVVPNGVDCQETPYTSIEARLNNKRELGLANEKIGLFMGSWHKPNLEACEEIFKIAIKCPAAKFLLMGSQCSYFEQKKFEIPSNVGMLGVVSEETKNKVFATVDFALNPMLSGSGTNLKMFDYMSAGIPVITTEFGARGIQNQGVLNIMSVQKMPDSINEFNLELVGNLVIESRKYVESTFDWGAIGDILLEKLLDD